MRWIERGRQIGLAVKSVPRLRQISGVFAKHGFGEVITRLNLSRYLPKRYRIPLEQRHDKSTPERLRLAFEELGPTFVKLGQVLSTRPDLLPESFIEEFVKLQDNVAPITFEAAKGVIEKDLKGKIEDLFQYVNPQPLASASIAQVHEAVLRSGEKVVIKVQRPDIDRIVLQDINILTFVAALLERYVPETRILNPSIFVSEFFRTLSFELDFVVEANNIQRISENMAALPDIVIPRVFSSLSSHRVLTLQRLEGIRVNDIPAIDAQKIDRKRIAKLGARAFFKAVMVDGLFHGDLHGGNLFILPGNRIGIIDFGIVGRISQKSRDQLANMVLSLLEEDFENLCFQYAELGAAPPSVDFENFQRDLRNTLSPYMGLNISQVNTGKILVEATKIAAHYKIRIPGEWMIVFRAILTMEGMGRSLDPDLDIMLIGQEFVKDILKNQYSIHRVRKDLMWIGKDLVALLQTLPRQIRWMFKKFNRNDFALEIKIPELQQIQRQLRANNKRLGFAIIATGLFLSASIALQYTSDRDFFGYPAVSVVFFVLAGIMFLRFWLL